MRLLTPVFLILSLCTLPAFAEQAACPVQLAEAQTQTLLVAQSRDSLEQRLAQAIRANQELARAHDAVQAELKKAKAPKAEAPKEEPKP